MANQATLTEAAERAEDGKGEREEQEQVERMRA
jgi:hypothetical protein